MAGKRGRRGNREGSVRLMRGKWTIRYYDEDGSQRERVTDAQSKRQALTHLRKALDEVEKARGRSPIRTVAELYAFHRRQRLALRKSVYDLDKRWKRLAPHFGSTAPTGVSSTMVAAYAEHRATDRVRKSTVNRELATLRHLLRVGAQATPQIVPWDAIPRIQLADESDLIRTAFFEEEEWAKLLRELADHLRPLFTIAYWLGWRSGELRNLQRSQVDLERGTIRLTPGSTKSKDGRLVYLPAEALAVLREQERATKVLERATQRLIPWVFHNRGKQIRDYYTGWRAACVRAGCPGMRPHDFRRTAARAYTRAGIGEQIVMKITGHKTRAIFDRYNITAESDLADAARRVTRHQNAARKGRARDARQ